MQSSLELMIGMPLFFKGTIVAVDREEFPDLDDDEFYWVDLTV